MELWARFAFILIHLIIIKGQGNENFFVIVITDLTFILLWYSSVPFFKCHMAIIHIHVMSTLYREGGQVSDYVTLIKLLGVPLADGPLL